MAMLRLNGWEIPIEDRQLKRISLALGAQPELHGRPRHARRTARAAWKLRTSLLAPDDAETLEGLAAREGWAFPWDPDLWSSGGLAPEAGYGATVSAGTATVTTSLTYRPYRHGVPAIRSRWTVMVWRGTDHYVVRSDGAKWLNGVRADGTSTTWLAVALGAVGLGAGAYRDLVILPFVASAAAIEAWHAWLDDDHTWPRHPHLTADGDITDAESLTVLLEPGTTSYHQAALDGWHSNARRVEVGLVELARFYPAVIGPPPGAPTLWYSALDLDGDGTDSAAYADGAIAGAVVNKGSRGAEGDLAAVTPGEGLVFKTAAATGFPFPVLRSDAAAGTHSALQSSAFASDGAHPVKILAIAAPRTLSTLTRMWSNRKDSGNYLSIATTSAPVYAQNGSNRTAVPILNTFDATIALAEGGVGSLSVNGVAGGSAAVNSNALMDGIVLGGHAGFTSGEFDWVALVVWEGSYPTDTEILAWAAAVCGTALPYTP